MKFLKTFNIFESTGNKLDIIKQRLIDEKLFNYMKLVVAQYEKNKVKDLNEFLNNVVSIIKDSQRFRIDIAELRDIDDLENKLERSDKKSKVSKFIDYWCPGFLKKAVRDNPLSAQLYPYIDKVDKTKFSKKISLCQNTEDFINAIILSCEEPDFSVLYKNNNADIYIDTDDLLICKSKTYDAMLTLTSPYWCTSIKSTYKGYVENKGFFYIYWVKKAPEKSKMLVIKNDIKPIINIFDYYDIEDEVGDSENVHFLETVIKNEKSKSLKEIVKKHLEYIKSW